jgi:hypothetical protein
MSLLDELKQRRKVIDSDIESYNWVISCERDKIDAAISRAHDLDRAIAALEPAPIPEPETQTGEGVEIPEGFTKWQGGAFPFDYDDKVHLYLANGEYRWDTNAALWMRRFESGEVLAYHIIEASAQDETRDQGASDSVVQTLPGEVEESRDESDDESERAAAIELTADVEPEPEFIELDQETCEPVQPQWNEPQTEGYAPVVDQPATNPEADTIARAQEYYSPEKMGDRNRSVFNIFRHKREDA